VFQSLGPFSTKITFYLNGTRIEFDSNIIDPDSTLLDFIRAQGDRLTGVDVEREVVVLVQSSSNHDILSQKLCSQFSHFLFFYHCLFSQPSGNTCLAPIVSVDGKHIITVEGISSSDNPHPLQERLWKMSGSQCGFCTVSYPFASSRVPASFTYTKYSLG
jgi:xanthine dehydrogenase/oxidase